MKGKLILENGVVFDGECFGDLNSVVGEVVFNTGMTGYQEVLTDPSYYGQIVTMTYPLIGNYGINLEDSQSDKPKVKGFVVREKCNNPSNWRCEMNLDTYLEQNKIIGIQGIDTRELTKIIRTKGTMKGIITIKDIDVDIIQTKLRGFSNIDAVKMVTRKKIDTFEGDGIHIGVMDFGIKENILRSFINRGCKLTVFPVATTSEEMLSYNIDGIFLSNGPGDPKDLPKVLKTIKELINIKPLTGICLGHQLICLALDADTERMKFGHRGCNHPVKNLKTGKVTITSQNHGYVVKEGTLHKDIVITHINVNDSSIEGIQHKHIPLMSVQYHPEASPGPHESDYIFDEFIKLYEEEAKKCQ